MNDGSFVWADYSSQDFPSTATNQFDVRATGGTNIYSNSSLTAGVTLSPGASSWSSVSDSTLKRNARVVDGEAILQKLVRLPIKQWSYKAQDPSIEHIGPMAQDFYSIFGLGENNKTISTIDPSGVALAAVQQLYKENQDLKTRLEKMEALFNKLLAEPSLQNQKSISSEK